MVVWPPHLVSADIGKSDEIYGGSGEYHWTTNVVFLNLFRILVMEVTVSSWR